MLPSARPREALRRPRGEERGGAYRGGRPHDMLVFISFHTVCLVRIQDTIACLSTRSAVGACNLQSRKYAPSRPCRAALSGVNFKLLQIFKHCNPYLVSELLPEFFIISKTSFTFMSSKNVNITHYSRKLSD